MKRFSTYWPFELLDGFFGNSSGFIAEPRRERLNEKEDGWVLEISLPGFKKEDVEVKTENGVLEIHGKTTRWDKVDYNKIYTLPDEVDQEKISAKMEDGILEITLPKYKEEEKKEKTNLIEIQ
jgi:HSP20 family protein